MNCAEIGKKPIPCNPLNLIRVGLAEFFGTALLLFLSCTGCTIGVQGEISSLHSSMAAGLAVLTAIQIFGHVSGAHINPVVTLAALIMNEVNLTQLVVYVLCQIFGGLTGAGFHKLLTPDKFYTAGNLSVRGVCVNGPHEHVTEWQALGVEIILTIALVIANCASWDHINSHKMDSVALRIGLIVVALNLSAGAYTGASMNPARSLGPAVWTQDFKSHWIYWAGPIIGSLIGAYFYKICFLVPKMVV
ncbi:hypothetical protein JTB14_014997 [Gonioctena quinquepunctata]|nr:hypothetical protein JTB14_014997 [Gonioctena quinquepunctata]